MGKIGKSVGLMDVIRVRRALVHDKLNVIGRELFARARNHDNSAMGSPEVEVYRRYFDNYMEFRPGDPRREEVIANMAPAIGHHFLANDHHPEHFDKGLDDMDLIQITHFLADMMSCSEQEQVDIYELLEMARNRYSMSDQMYHILCNSVKKIKELGR